MKTARLNWVWIIFTVAALAALGTCTAGRNATPTARSGMLTLSRNPAQLAPFKREDLANVVGNNMHEAHFAAQVHCGQCHLSTAPLPPDRAHEVCGECHPKREMAKSVWSNHCLACHYFTPEVEQAARKPAELTQLLCLKCHEEQDPFGGHLYVSCTDPIGEMVLCDHCHRPHDHKAPAAIELCVECHKDLTEARHPKGSDAKCSLCHKPHSPRLEGDKICITCHGQAENVLVHKISTHPKDCLQCHKAHFTAIEIKGVCADCHEGMVYRPGRNLPTAHTDCQSCHRLEDFNFKGASACVSCHKTEGAILKDKSAPVEHKRCLTCHAPHTWRASFERNCDNCHDLSQVQEHQLPYHPKNCEACHDPHKPMQMPKSGDCDGCHEMHKNVPPFGREAPSAHTTCENCHLPEGLSQGEFEFVGAASSCFVCHTEASSGKEWSAVPEMHQECLNCHTPHTFALADPAVSCNVCHADVLSQLPNAIHQQCANCHAQDHSFAFAGAEYSCQLCHPDAISDVPHEMHKDCNNCHLSDHTVGFAGVEFSCKVCHGAPPGLHAKDSHAECMNCHQTHSFKVESANSCALCHGDLVGSHYPQQDCMDCHFFRAGQPAGPAKPPAAATGTAEQPPQTSPPSDGQANGGTGR